jgi:hypothetical protein
MFTVMDGIAEHEAGPAIIATKRRIIAADLLQVQRDPNSYTITDCG